MKIDSGSGSGSYSGGLTWSIVLRCDDHTDIFTCDGCARDGGTRSFMCRRDTELRDSTFLLKESPDIAASGD